MLPVLLRASGSFDRHVMMFSFRCMWAGVTTVKLFIDYMSPLVRDTDSVRVEPINYNLLWTVSMASLLRLSSAVGLSWDCSFQYHQVTEKHKTAFI